MNSAKGMLYVVSAPSGCGKGTILERILSDGEYYYSVSATTRAPREGEVDGVNYLFKTRTEFEELIASDGILEYAEYCGNYYGTPLQPIQDCINSGRDVILEIEVQGALKVKEKCPEAVLIFILPPSIEELRRRLSKRGTEAEEVIQKRCDAAEKEIEQSVHYDFVMTNADLDDAVSDLSAILRSAKLWNRSAG